MHKIKCLMTIFRGSKVVNLLLFGMLLLTPVSYAQTNWNIDDLMQSLAAVHSGQASFTEKKFIAMLDKPVESSGMLFYTAPDRLEKRTLTPQPESMSLDKDKLMIEQQGKKRQLALQRYPEIAAFIDSIRATLAGDRQALERAYRLSMEGDEKSWRLILLPTEAKMKKLVLKITIAGDGNLLRAIEIELADGDRSLMTIVPLSAS